MLPFPDPLTLPNASRDALQPSIRDRIIAGSLWLISVRWMLRVASVVRTVTLARLLVPADFGMFAMTMLVIQPLHILMSWDIHLALIRDAGPTGREFDTAWTLRAAQRLALAALLCLLAPLGGRYFNQPELTAVIRVFALAVAVAAFENIGTVAFRKDLDFAKEVSLIALSALLTLVLTIVAAVIWRNYWALIIGIVVERSTTTVLSYVYHPYRPRFSLRAVRELWSFSQWIPLQNVGSFVKDSLGSFLVARVFGAASLGLYSMAGSAAGLTAELLAPVSNALLPGYAKVAHDARRLAHAYLDALRMLAFLFIPGTVGLVMTAPTLVPVVLGSKWTPAIPIIQALAVYEGINGLSSTVANLLMAAGRMRRLTLLVYVQVAAYTPVLAIAAFYGDPTRMAIARAGVALLVAPILFQAVRIVSSVDLAGIGWALVRPATASALMAGALLWVQTSIAGHGLWSLACQVSAGVISYAAATAVVWVLAGRPPGPERTGLEWIRDRWRAQRVRR